MTNIDPEVWKPGMAVRIGYFHPKLVGEQFRPTEVVRVTKTQVITADGRRWKATTRLDRLVPVGSGRDGHGLTRRLYPKG